MRELVNVMKALSDPGRLKVLKMLEAREMCACEIIGLLGLAQPTVSRHLKVLLDAGLINGRKVGSWVHYRLAQAPPTAYARAMLAALPGWLEADPEIRALRQAVGQLAPLKLSTPQACADPCAACTP
ncbi:MAG: metalloregulator ArsR/SmtB family transcription factor [Humidesulfovibrio sp.]|nr:transcriptional regulator [Desulfovibrio sp.]MDO9082485.1 metalloregulator ArsR/SmtB family transcription factor [Humidesulfovibrio sp.]